MRYEAALEASRMETDDEKKQEEALKEVASKLSKIEWNGTSLTISHKAVRTVGKVTGVKDPYKDSDDPLLTATKLSIAGNVIDFSPDRDFVVEDVIEETLEKDFAIDHFDQFKEELEKAEDIIYLSDNTGEIVFDRIFLETRGGKDVRFFVKSSAILNDAMIEDAKFVGIDKIAEIEEVEDLNNVSEELKERLRNADLVISKGQANYEAFSETDANIFFLLMVKCHLIGDDIGAEEGSTIVKWKKKNNPKNPIIVLG